MFYSSTEAKLAITIIGLPKSPIIVNKCLVAASQITLNPDLDLKTN